MTEAVAQAREAVMRRREECETMATLDRDALFVARLRHEHAIAALIQAVRDECASAVREHKMPTGAAGNIATGNRNRTINAVLDDVLAALGAS